MKIQLAAGVAGIAISAAAWAQPAKPDHPKPPPRPHHGPKMPPPQPEIKLERSDEGLELEVKCGLNTPLDECAKVAQRLLDNDALSSSQRAAGTSERDDDNSDDEADSG